MLRVWDWNSYPTSGIMTITITSGRGRTRSSWGHSKKSQGERRTNRSKIFVAKYLQFFPSFSRPWDPNELINANTFELQKAVKDTHWKHFASYISSAIKRFPFLKEAVYDHLSNTPDAFTPDGRWIMGESPEVGNYHVCAGMNGNSLQVT